jgi:hypothetical protein
MNMKQAVVGVLTTGCLIGVAILLPNVGQAQDAKVKTAMDLLGGEIGSAEDRGSNPASSWATKDQPATSGSFI